MWFDLSITHCMRRAPGNVATCLFLLLTSMSTMLSAFRHYHNQGRLISLHSKRSSLVLPHLSKRLLSVGAKSSKPDFSREINEKYFDYNRLEPSLYSWWEGGGMFKPDIVSVDKAKGKKPFVVPMPPPNVTGYLHMGHAIFIALQDIMSRFHRMRGRPTLWLPGT